VAAASWLVSGRNPSSELTTVVPPAAAAEGRDVAVLPLGMGSCSGLSLVASRRAPQRRSRSGTEVGSAAQGGSVDRRAEPAGRRGVCSCGDSAGPPVQAATGRVAGGTPVARAYWAGLAVAGGGHRCDGSSSRRALRAGAGRRRGGDHSGDRGDLGAGRTFPASTLGGVVPTRGTAGRIEVRLHACAHDGGFVSARLRLRVLPSVLLAGAPESSGSDDRADLR
jgi:hypothetical protein